MLRGGAAQQQDKFVAALAAGHVLGAQVFKHRAADEAQGAVASGMAEEVVDLLEVVDVKVQQHRGAGFVLQQRVVGQCLKVAAVGHLGQRVLVGQHTQPAARVAQLAFGAFAHERDGHEGHDHGAQHGRHGAHGEGALQIELRPGGQHRRKARQRHQRHRHAKAAHGGEVAPARAHENDSDGIQVQGHAAARRQPLALRSSRDGSGRQQQSTE